MASVYGWCDDENRTAALCRALEERRRDAAPRCKDGASADKPSLSSGPKHLFLDRRQIMHLNRGSGVSVVWPRDDAKGKGHGGSYVGSK